MKGWLSIHVVAAALIAVFSGCQQGKQAKADTPRAEIRAAEMKRVPVMRSGQVPAKTARATASKSDKQEAAVSHGGKAGVLTAADDGREISLHQGQTVNVVLDSNHANGFAWAVTSPTAGVMVSEEKGMYAVKSGGRGTETWRFLAMKPGRQTVRLEYRTEWTRNMPERTFRFTAIVK